MIGFGQICNSAYFDGIDDKITIEYPLVSNQPVPLDFPGAFTIEFWIKTNQSDPYPPYIIYKHPHDYSTNTNAYGELIFAINNGFLTFRATNYGSTHNSLISLNPINDSTWHHVAGVRDINDQMYLYIDGVLVSQEIGCSGTVCEGPNPITIGYYFDNTISSYHFNGNLENLRIWNKALVQTEIQQNMNKCLINDSSLILYYDFDEIVGWEFLDQTGTYGNDIFDISLDTISPICCDCQINTSDTTICPGDVVTITTSSTLNPLWDNGDTASSIVVLVNTDTTITLYFLDNLGSVICSDDITITINQTTAPTIQQVGNNLMSSNGQNYQWYLNGIMLSGETGQLFSILGDGDYTVEVTDQNGCNTMSVIFNVSTSSVLDIENTNPNLIGIFDLFGKRLNEKTNNKILLMFFDDGTVEKRITIE